jgi:hypothetical protein
VVVDIALGVGAAVAGVHTVPVEAGESLETLVIALTAHWYLRFRFDTGDSGVSDVT